MKLSWMKLGTKLTRPDAFSQGGTNMIGSWTAFIKSLRSILKNLLSWVFVLVIWVLIQQERELAAMQVQEQLCPHQWYQFVYVQCGAWCPLRSTIFSTRKQEINTLVELLVGLM